MDNLNSEFFENYIRIEKFCRDAYGEKGVSEYLEEMERVGINNSAFYKELKHKMWIRNQLAHTPGAMNSHICTQEDVQWTEDFYQKLMKAEDPLALALNRKSAQENTYLADVYKSFHRVQVEENKGRGMFIFMCICFLITLAALVFIFRNL